MKVVSDTTLVVKKGSGVVEYPPGTVVEYGKEQAEELVSRGYAREYVPEAPPEASAAADKTPKGSKPAK